MIFFIKKSQAEQQFYDKTYLSYDNIQFLCSNPKVQQFYFLYNHYNVLILIILIFKILLNRPIQTELPMSSHPVPKKQKLQRRTFYGYKRENIQQQIKSYTMPTINYRIIPSGIARHASLRNKLECLLGRSVFTYGKPHPSFRYLLQKLIFYEAVNSNKRTDYRMIVGNENSAGLNDSQLEREVKKMVEEIIAELQIMQNEGVYMFTKEIKREERLEIFAKQMTHFRQKLREKLKEEAAERKLSAYRLGREVDFIDSEEYVDELIDNVDRIETLRESQQIVKFNIFLQRNIHYFGVTLKSSHKIHQIIINRPSSQMEPLLQNLTQMVGMRSSQISYQQESVVMIKNIYQQLKIYQQNPNGILVFYEHLHPNHIIFDQVALNVKLSFEPLLLDLFGLKKKPMSLEARIAFSPTPAAFDYFRALQQIDSGSEIDKNDQINNVPLVLDDPFFGNRALYENEKHRPELASDIEEQKRQLQHMKGRILTGRFLLLSHYILNSVQYGYKPNLTSNHEKITNLRSQLTSMKQSLQNDMSKLSDFMGIQNALVAGKPFNFGMSDLGDFMSIDNDDSLLDSNKHVLTRKYFQMRTLIIKQFIRLLVNDKIFGRIFNIKKYILLYLAISIEVIEQARKLIQVELKQKKQRKKLRKYLDTTLIRLKSDKHHFGYLQTTYQKIIHYRNRDPLKDHQAKFARDDELGKKAMAFIEEVSKLMHFLQQKQEKLNQWEQREDLSTDQKQAYSEVLKQVDAAVTGGAEKVRGILNQFIFNELRLKYAEGPHRNADDKTQKQWLNMFTNRLELLTLVYISFSEENFLLYSTLVIPRFHIDDTDKKFEMPPKISEELKSEENSLKLVSEIIDSSKLLPRKMVYFATKTSNEELKIYERSKQQ